MDQQAYKRFTEQAKRGIKGEAFFEALVSNYSLPHRIAGSRDLGIDYLCEWVHGDRPAGVLYAVQVKTFSQATAIPQYIGIEEELNGLEKYRIVNHHLTIDDRTLHYWRGLGMPVYLCAVVQSASSSGAEALDCYYKRFTQVLTTNTRQEDCCFYKVNRGSAFRAFAHPDEGRQGFARDLFIDHMRWCYYKGSIAYLNPRTIGLNQFQETDSVFVDLFQEYGDRVCATYFKAKGFLEEYCTSGAEGATY